MLLKKQTVWLLTMLSLVVVLSVYYITTPEPNQTNLAAVDEQEENTNVNEEGEAAESTEMEIETDETIISGIASDEQFEALRLELNDQRSERKAELQDIVASTDLPVDQRNEAYDDMKELDTIANKEQVLETLIKTMGYEDALVRADGEKVRITVKAGEHSKAEANEIIQMVRNELGSLQAVAVTFQPVK